MENKIAWNSLGEMVVESAYSLENDFIKALAAGDGTEEDLSGEVSQRPDMQDTGDMPPLSETDSVISEDDNQLADTIDFDNFKIDVSKNYAAMLESSGSDPKDAMKKAYFIKFTDPDTGKIYAVQGPMFGKNREEGVGESWVGGYETQQEAEEDLHKMITTWDMDNGGGFPADREYMLVELSELSPDLVKYEKKQQQSLPEKVDEQKQQAEKADEEEEPEPELEVPEEEAAPVEEAPKSTAPQPSVPKPLKKVPAFLVDIKLKRESRLQRLNMIKGK